MRARAKPNRFGILAVLAAVALAASLLAALTNPAQASFPGENGKIAFAGFEFRGIYTMDADGSNLTRVTTAADNAPAFSADGQKIAFAREEFRSSGIYVMDADGSNQRRIASGGAPAFSSDGQRIAFERDADIYIMDADGTNQQRLTTTGSNEAVEVEPVFSPNGQKIAFAKTTNSNVYDIYVMDVDGSNQQQLTSNTASLDTNPNFSPDGQKITFRHANFGEWDDIWVMDADGSNRTNLTNTTADSEGDPAFSPDGQKIVFMSHQVPLGKYDIYVMDADGSNRTNNLTSTINTADGDARPDWQPLPITDTTAPTLELPGGSSGGITEEATSANGATVNYTATATDDVDGDVNVTCDPASGSTFPVGTTTVNCSATDAAGNEATASFTVTVEDTTAPTISGVPSDITRTADSSSGTNVTYSSPTATDAVDGSVNVSCEPPSGSTFPLGETTVTCSATDQASNEASESFKVKILYGFNGFFQPVDNLPTLNSVNAGRAIPMKFGLGGDQGLGIFAAGYPKSQQVACDSTAPVDGIEETVTAGGSSLQYDPGANRYNYVWKTDKAWAGTCRQFVMKLKDGSLHRANFKFR